MGVSSKLTTVVARSCLPSSVFAFGSTDSPSGNCSATVYLTFDDGPDPETTPLILDHLDELNVKATFFVEGRKAVKHAALIHRINNAGHSIGTHSWNHLSVSEVSNRMWIEDVQRARALIEDTLGMSCPLFRAPYGHYSLYSVAKLLLSGYRFVHWNSDTKDYEMSSETDLIDWFSSQAFSAETIVLMHDNHKPAAHCLTEAIRHTSKTVTFTAIPMHGFSTNGAT